MSNGNRSYEIVLDRYLNQRNQAPVFTQFDTETAKLTFKFLENGAPFIIPYTRLVLVVQKPDMKEVYQEIEIFNGNTAEVILNNQALTSAGKLVCQIRMYQESKLESTWQFEVKVNPTIGNDNPVKSENDYQVLQQLIMDVDSNIDKNNQVVKKLIEQTNQSVSENIQNNNQALMEALAKIDESELVRLKDLIDLLQQNKLAKTEKAADSQLLNGRKESQTPANSTILLRDGNGDVMTHTAVLFTDAEHGGGIRGSIGIDNVNYTPKFKDNQSVGYDIWCNKNLTIESGSWSPVLTNETAAFQMNTTSTSGRYYRIGNLVYIQGRARASSKTGVSGGKLTIEGLPFASQYSGQHVNLSIYSGLVFATDAKEVLTYMQAGTNKFSFYYTRSGASYQAWNCDNVSGECDIYFCGSYKIN